MNAITQRTAGGAVAALNNLKAGLQNVAATIVTAGGDPYLRLLTDGQWVYGADNVEVQEGSLWALNPFSIMHGFVSWTDHPGKQANEIVGEVMVPAGQALPVQTELQDTGWPWVQQLSIQLRCMNGEDIGTQVLYKTSSVGGMNAVKKVINEIMAHLAETVETPVPLITLETDHYMHKKWGKTYVPILSIAKFIALEDEAPAVDDEPESEEVPAASPVRSRTASPAAEAAPKPRTRPAKPAEEKPAKDEPAETVAVSAADRKAALLAEIARLEKAAQSEEPEPAEAEASTTDAEPAPRRRRR